MATRLDDLQKKINGHIRVYKELKDDNDFFTFSGRLEEELKEKKINEFKEKILDLKIELRLETRCY